MPGRQGIPEQGCPGPDPALQGALLQLLQQPSHVPLQLLRALLHVLPRVLVQPIAHALRVLQEALQQQDQQQWPPHGPQRTRQPWASPASALRAPRVPAQAGLGSVTRSAF